MRRMRVDRTVKDFEVDVVIVLKIDPTSTGTRTFHLSLL
jgi:hypothetical protein